MPTLQTTKRTRDIKYMSRDFESLKLDLKNYLKYQFPEAYKDFSDNSSGMAFLELVAYVGDILNFYIDKQFNELFLQNAQERKNVISIAKNLGYTERGKTGSSVLLTVTATYPVTGSNTAFTEFILNKGTQVVSDNGSFFETTMDIDFSSISSRTISTNIEDNTTTVTVTGIPAVNGQTRNYSFSVGLPESFLRVRLPDPDVLEVISVTSSDGNTWYQADYLAQETQFFGIVNTASTSADSPYVLNLRKIPRRFIIEKDEFEYTHLVFGSGKITTDDADFIPEPADFVLPSTIRGKNDGFLIPAVDPENFLLTGTLGAAPNSTVLDIKYRIGGGISTNVGAGTITDFSDKKITFLSTSAAFQGQRTITQADLTVNNEYPAAGGLDEESLEELRYLAAKNFGAQNRTITISDYVARAMSMPGTYGTPYRVQARRDPDTDFGVELVILSKNSDGTLATSSDQLKLNLGNYLTKFKPLNDTINITNGRIINIGVQFGIITNRYVNSQEVLANCLIKLKEYFDIKNWQFGQPISLSYLNAILQSVYGVLSVSNLSINNILGTVGGNTYSNDKLSILSNTKNNVIYIPADSIFEVKYPNIDIRGGFVQAPDISGPIMI